MDSYLEFLIDDFIGLVNIDDSSNHDVKLLLGQSSVATCVRLQYSLIQKPVLRLRETTRNKHKNVTV